MFQKGCGHLRFVQPNEATEGFPEDARMRCVERMERMEHETLSLSGRKRRKSPGRRAIAARPPVRAASHTASSDKAVARDKSAPAILSTTPPPSPGLFKTKSGFDITQRVMELIWPAAEGNQLTFEMVREAFEGEDLTPEDLDVVRETLAQAGVKLVYASAVASVRSAFPTVATQPAVFNQRRSSVPNCAPESREAHRLQRETALLKRMEQAEREMKRIFHGFGFAAREYIARAEKLLAHPSEENFQRLVVDSDIRSRKRHLKILPMLVKEARGLDQKAGAAYRDWRRAPRKHEAGRHETNFRKCNDQLRKAFPRFGYQTRVMLEMIRIAQNLAARFQAGRRVLEQARSSRDSVCQMSLVDVELQALETMEEFARMNGQDFLRDCERLAAAGRSFEEARCELVQDCLRWVADAAPTYSNRGLPLPPLVRAGISGLLRAVETFAYRHERTFSAYAACWIRQSIRDALAFRPHNGSVVTPQNYSHPALRLGGVQHVKRHAANAKG